MMIKVILFMVACYLCPISIKATEIDGIDSQLLEKFLSNLYSELKCPSYPRLTINRLQKGEACLVSLKYNFETSEKIVFIYDTYLDDNRYLQNFKHLGAKDRQKNMLNLLEYLAKVTGIKPVPKVNIYVGKIQTTVLSHVINNRLLSDQEKIRDYVQNHAVIGVRLLIDEVPNYMAYLDSNHIAHYKEQIGISVHDFENISDRN